MGLPLRRRRRVTSRVQRSGRFEMTQTRAIPDGAYIAQRKVGRDGHCRWERIRRGSGPRSIFLVALHRLRYNFGKTLDRVHCVMSSLTSNVVDRFDCLVR